MNDFRIAAIPLQGVILAKQKISENKEQPQQFDGFGFAIDDW